MENLPTEVATLILEYVPNMKSLWALVRASPHFYYIFYDECREHILKTVISREIGTVLMGDALAALGSSRFTSTQEVNGETIEVPIRGLPKTDALEWIEMYKEVVNVASVSLTLEDSLPLWELHKDVKALADLFVQESLPVFLILANEKWENWEPLETPYDLEICTLEDYSFIEQQRLFRAIYRFVIFGNLFAPTSVEVCSSWEQCEHFLCLLTSWQVEELSCINDFIRNKILMKWQEMEHNKFNCLVADPELREIAPLPNPPTSRWHADFFSADSKKQHFKDTQANFVSLSIKELIEIFEAKDAVLETLVKKRALAFQRSRAPFLNEALDIDPGSIAAVIGGVYYQFRGEWDHDGEEFLVFEKDDLASANAFWEWANLTTLGNMYFESTRHRNDRDCEAFRRVGYVFLASTRPLPHYPDETFGERSLEKFPLPVFEDMSLSVEERIRMLADCECGEVGVPKKSNCKVEGQGDML